jgi:hypothetical protein
MRVTTISGMKTSLRHLIGLDALQSSEEDAAVASFNRFGKLAWDRTTWPFNCVLKQVIPDVRVRSVNVGSGGSGYTGTPSAGFSGGGGTGAAGTVTTNSDDEVNGVAMTNPGTGYTSAPTVAITGGSGSGATATATIIAVLDFGTTMDTVFNVWTSDPFGASVPAPIAFRIEPEAGTSEYGLAVLDNHSSTAPVWVHYRTPFSSFGGSATDYPDLFAPYAVMGGYGDWLVADGQTSKGQEAFAQAESILASELDKLERQQNQQSRILMTTYGTTAASPS